MYMSSGLPFTKYENFYLINKINNNHVHLDRCKFKNKANCDLFEYNLRLTQRYNIVQRWKACLNVGHPISSLAPCPPRRNPLGVPCPRDLYSSYFVTTVPLRLSYFCIVFISWYFVTSILR